METKLINSTGFTHHFSPAELYVLTRHWMSDISFFEKEMFFLESLLAQICADGELSKNPFSIVKEHLSEVISRKDILKENIEVQQQRLIAILDKTQQTEEVQYSTVHNKLEGDFFDFIKAYRKLKLELFQSWKSRTESLASKVMA